MRIRKPPMRTLETALLLIVQLFALRLLGQALMIRIAHLMKEVMALLFTLPDFH